MSTLTPIPGLRSPAAHVNGLVHFGRMLDKIRLHHAGQLPAEYVSNLGKGFDGRCVSFLRISYPALVDRTTSGSSSSDEELLAWAFAEGRQPTAEEIEIWNEFMTKRGWKDPMSETLVKRKHEHAFADRSDIETFFQFIDADEGRL